MSLLSAGPTYPKMPVSLEFLWLYLNLQVLEMANFLSQGKKNPKLFGGGKKTLTEDI